MNFFNDNNFNKKKTNNRGEEREENAKEKKPKEQCKWSNINTQTSLLFFLGKLPINTDYVVIVES